MLLPSGNLFKCHEEVLYLQPIIPPKRFEIFPLTGGCSEGLDVCVFCVFSSHHAFWTSSSLLDVPAGVTQEEGHTGFFIHLPSAVRGRLHFSREKDSAIPFPRRPCSQVLCTNDLIFLHSVGILFLFFIF